MQSGVFSGLFGALSNEHRMNSIANNLANINTTGYKRDTLAFRDTFIMFAHDQIMEPVANVRSDKLFPEPKHMARPRLAESRTDFSQGPLKTTGGPLDLAISGDGFFSVRTPEGDYYSRNGHFRLTPEGTLITEQGFQVLGDGGGEIVIPPGIKNLVIAEDGRLFGDGDLIGQIGFTGVDDLTNLEKVGANMYRAKNGAQVGEVEAQGFMVQGFLEAPNVDVVYEMVNMIEAQRQFEAYQKAMQSSDALDREAYSKVGKMR